MKQPIERLEAKQVQSWIDGLINPEGETGLSTATVERKLSEPRDYWRYMPENGSSSPGGGSAPW